MRAQVRAHDLTLHEILLIGIIFGLSSHYINNGKKVLHFIEIVSPLFLIFLLTPFIQPKAREKQTHTHRKIEREDKMGVNEDFNKDIDDHHHEYVDDDDVPLPGFRFHPTDEELVSFYLQRKLDKKPISIELIKQIDIYKYDPWDLPSMFVVCTLN